MPIVQVFDDRQRLGKHYAVDAERGDQALRIELEVVGGAMLVARELFRHRLVLQPLEIQRDPHAERRGAAEERVQLHASPITSSSTIHRFSIPAATSGTASASCHSHNASHISANVPPLRTAANAAVSSGSSERYCVFRSWRHSSHGCGLASIAGSGGDCSSAKALNSACALLLSSSCCTEG